MAEHASGRAMRGPGERGSADRLNSSGIQAGLGQPEPAGLTPGGGMVDPGRGWSPAELDHPLGQLPRLGRLAYLVVDHCTVS